MTRDEHVEWCKKRALEYLPHDPLSAMTSMMSDMEKHEDTKNHAGNKIAVQFMLIGKLSTADEVRKFIEGYR